MFADSANSNAVSQACAYYTRSVPLVFLKPVHLFGGRCGVLKVVFGVQSVV